MWCYPARIFYDHQILEEMICIICRGVMREPVADPCGHAFGKRCIEDFVLKNQCCPISRRSFLNSNELSDCLPFKNVIGRLKIRCPNHEFCQWSGKLEQLESHTENDCLHEEVLCPSKNCGVKNPRWIMNDHLKNCLFRLSKCSLCEAVVNFKDRKDHEDNCPEQSIKCPFQCGSDVKRKVIESHFKRECAEVTTECEYRDQGCDFVGKRGEIEEHYTSAAGSAKHVSLMLRALSNWHVNSQKSIAAIDQKISRVEMSIEEIRRQICSKNSRPMNREPSLSRQAKNSSYVMKDETMDHKVNSVITEFSQLKQMSLETQQGVKKLGNTIIETINQQLKPKIADIYVSMERNRHLLYKNWKDKERDKGQSANHICFDPDAKGGALALISPKEIENIGSGMMALANLRLSPGKPIRFLICKQIDNLFAVGACIKKAAQDALFLWPVGINHGYYFFYASGDVLKNGKEGYFKPDGQKLTFGSGDNIEIQLDSNCKKITARNLNNKSFAEISLKDGEIWKDLYPCVRIQQKGEAIKILS